MYLFFSVSHFLYIGILLATDFLNIIFGLSFDHVIFSMVGIRHDGARPTMCSVAKAV